jgi:hypothetical protein
MTDPKVVSTVRSGRKYTSVKHLKPSFPRALAALARISEDETVQRASSSHSVCPGSSLNGHHTGPHIIATAVDVRAALKLRHGGPAWLAQA